MTTPLRLGIAGLGTVGIGTVKMVQAHGAALAAKAGRPIEITAVTARSRKDRGAPLEGYAWEDDPVALASRDDVDCVVEVIGGSDGPAHDLVAAALSNGKHVVTANKALIAEHGNALAEAAEASGAALRCEAGVAGGIPVLKALGEGLAGNEISRVFGVLNGTCNYILSEMEKTEAAYADVLSDASRLREPYVRMVGSARLELVTMWENDTFSWCDQYNSYGPNGRRCPERISTLSNDYAVVCYDWGEWSTYDLPFQGG